MKIGRFEVELVVRGSEATLSVVDDKEQPVDASRFSATAVALARGNERRTLEFRRRAATAWWRRSTSPSTASSARP